MNIIISFAGLKSGQSAAPYALRHIAGSTILGHILVHLLDLPINKLILVVDNYEEQVEGWVQENVPELSLEMLPVEDGADPLFALYETKAVLDAEPLLFISGNYIVEADFRDLISSKSDVSCLVQADQDFVPAEELEMDEAGCIDGDGERTVRWAGCCWFRHGTDLLKALEAAADQRYSGLGPLLSNLSAQSAQISTRRAITCLDTRTEESMLHANARLLRLGRGTQDAIERSYAEDFMVLPPVFLHETAVIENSVIGPFVNLEANARVRNSVVRNSLIGKESVISDVVLADSLIGEGVVIVGQKTVLKANDGAIIKVGEESTKL